MPTPYDERMQQWYSYSSGANDARREEERQRNPVGVRRMETEGKQEFFGIGDLFEGLALGGVGAIESILELPSIIPGIDYDIPDNFGLGHADTTVGRFTEGMANFMLPFLIPGAGVAGMAAKGAAKAGKMGTAAKLTKLEKGLQGLKKISGHSLGVAASKKLGITQKTRAWARYQRQQGHRGIAAGIKHLDPLASGMIGGAAVDFVAFDPMEERFSNWIKDISGLDSAVLDFLEYKEGDSAAKGRIMNVLEGAALGGFVDSFIAGLKSLRIIHRAKKMGLSPEAAQREVHQESIQDMHDHLVESGVNEDDALHAVTQNLGLDPTKVHFGAIEEDILNLRVDEHTDELFQRREQAGIADIPEEYRAFFDDEEVKYLSREQVKNMIDTYDSLQKGLDVGEGGVDDNMIIAFAKAGQVVRGQYGYLSQTLLPNLLNKAASQSGAVVKDTDARLWAYLNAVSSAGNAPMSHAASAMMVLTEWRASGRSADAGELRTMLDHLTSKDVKLGRTTEGKDGTLMLHDKQKRSLIRILQAADKEGVTTQDFLKLVQKEVKKTHQFAGASLPEGGALAVIDRHMGILMGGGRQGDFEGFLKSMPNYQALQGHLRRIADGLGWDTRELQEAVWAGVVGSKGLLRYFQGDTARAVKNFNNEFFESIWDHNSYFRVLLENPKFEETMVRGGVDPKIIKQLKGGKGEFGKWADRPDKPEIGPTLELTDVDPEHLLQAVEHIAKQMPVGVAAGSADFVLKAARGKRGHYNIVEEIINTTDENWKKKGGLRQILQENGYETPDVLRKVLKARKDKITKLRDEIKVLKKNAKVANKADKPKQAKKLLAQVGELEEKVKFLSKKGKATRPTRKTRRTLDQELWAFRGAQDKNKNYIKTAEQEYTSAGTDVNCRSEKSGKMPAGYKAAKEEGMLREGGIFFDAGAGSPGHGSDLADDFLRTSGTTRLAFDPYNRDLSHNRAVVEVAHTRNVEAGGMFSTLNVIKEAKHRNVALRRLAAAVQKGGRVIFTVHEGTGKGTFGKGGLSTGGKATGGTRWQNNAKLEAYVDEIKKVFSDVEVKRVGGEKVIVANNTKLKTHYPKDTDKRLKTRQPIREMFQTGEDGKVARVVFGEEGTEREGHAYIESLQAEGKLDVTNVIHEQSHIVRRLQMSRDIPEDQRMWADFELDAVDEAFGVKPGEAWTEDQEELFARAWEKFVMEGELPANLKGTPVEVALAKLSARARGIYDEVQNAFDDIEVSDSMRDVFDKMLAHSDYRAVEAALPEEFRAMYRASQAARDTARAAEEGAEETRAGATEFAGGPTPEHLAMKSYTEELNEKYPDGWGKKGETVPRGSNKVPYADLTHGEKVKLGKLNAGLRRQEERLATAESGVEEYWREVESVDESLEDLHKELNVKYKGLREEAEKMWKELEEEDPTFQRPDRVNARGVPKADGSWDDTTIEPGELKRLESLREHRTELAEVQSIGYSAKAGEPIKGEPGSGWRDLARRGELPINLRAARKHQVSELKSSDEALDLMEASAFAHRRDLARLNPERREEVLEESFRIHEDLLASMGRNPSKENLRGKLQQLQGYGLKFVAGVRAAREFAADIFDAATENFHRLEKDADDVMAKATYLYNLGLHRVLVEHLSITARDAGEALRVHGVPAGDIGRANTKLGRPTSLQEAENLIEQTKLVLESKGDNLKDYLGRSFMALKEGQARFQSHMLGQTGGKMDTVLEIFYNSILSGPRTHAVNFLSNSIFGTLMHLERRVGRALMGSFLDKHPELKRAIAAKTSLKKVLSESFRMATVAFREAVPQLEPMGRGQFDQAKGVMTGRNKKPYADRLGMENLPEPLKGVFNVIGNIVGVGGLSTRLLGAGDEFFKQMHNRLVVTDGLTQMALDRLSGARTGQYIDGPSGQAFDTQGNFADAGEAAAWVVDEFNAIVGEGNKFSRARIYKEGYQRAADAGETDKFKLRRAAETHVKSEYEDRPWRQSLASRALEFAGRSTFTLRNDAEVGRNFVSKSIQHLGKSMQALTSEIPVAKLVVPFINTPTNLMSEAADRLFSPLLDIGLAKQAADTRRIIQDGLDEYGSLLAKDEKADAIGRVALSSSLISFIVLKTMDGEVTGGGPTDPDARQILLSAGWQPYSFRIGEAYYSYGRLDPVASVVGIVADISESANGNPFTDDPTEEGLQALMSASMMALFRNISEKSYLQGIISFAAGLENPEYYGGRTATTLAKSVVPNISAQVAQAVDPNIRSLRGIVDQWRNRIPFMGSDLLPRRNFLGEENKRLQYLGGPFLGLLNPIAYSETSSDIIHTEMAKFGETIGAPSAIKFGSLDTREYEKDGQTAYDRYQELQGLVTVHGRDLRTTLEGLISSPDYQRLPEIAQDLTGSPRKDQIDKVIRTFRNTAWEQTLHEFPELHADQQTIRYNKKARELGTAERQLIGLMR